MSSGLKAARPVARSTSFAVNGNSNNNNKKKATGGKKSESFNVGAKANGKKPAGPNAAANKRPATGAAATNRRPAAAGGAARRPNGVTGARPKATTLQKVSTNAF